METEDDDLPVMSPEQARAAGAVDVDDELPVMSPEQARAAGAVNVDEGAGELPDAQPEHLPAEGHLAADAREIAHNILPAVGGYAAAGAGASIGAAAGAPFAPFTAGFSIPVGTALGAIIGFAGGGLALSEIQERALKAFNGGDAEQRQANAEERPYETTAAGWIPGLAGMSLGTGIKVWQRLISAGALTTFEGAQEYMTDGHLDPIKLAMAAGAGAFFPTPNRAGQKALDIGENAAKHLLTGRQVTPPLTAAKPVPEAVEGFDPVTGDSTSEFDATGTPLAEAAGPGTGAQDAGVGGSAKVYPKEEEAPAENAGPTTIDPANPIKPDEAAAIKALEEPELPLDNPINQQHLQAGQGPTDFPPVEQQPSKRRERARRVANELAEDSKQPGIVSPQEPEGEEHHLPGPAGINQAKPKLVLPGEMPKGTQDEPIATKPTLSERAAEVRDDVHKSPSDAQIDAENFNKGHPGRFAGKAVSIETAKGGIRRSKPGQPPWEVEMPTDYGHLLGTKGADGDPLDIAIVGTGDKHFVIDQRDPETGKFDEHKIMAEARDEADALDHYERGFSDGKGAARVQNITEATEDQIRAWSNRLANMPAKRKVPYSPETAREMLAGNKSPPNSDIIPLDSASPVPERNRITATVNPAEEHPGGVLAKDRVAMRDLLRKLRAEGNDARADALEAMPNAELLKYMEENKIRRRNYGVKTGTSAGYPISDLKNPDGTPVTANKPEKAKLLGQSVDAVRQAFNEFKPPDTAEGDGSLLDRLRQGVARADELNGGKAATKYRPQAAGNRIEWTWADDARQLIRKPTPAKIAAFRDSERMLRGGEASALEHLKTRNIEGAMKYSHGDEGVAKAEAQGASQAHRDVEDDMAEYLDAKKGAFKADIPHEEAEEMVKPKPVKTAADLKEAKNKQIDMTTDAGHDQLDAIMDRGKALRQAPKEEAASAPVRKVELTPEQKAAAIESMNKAMRKSGGMLETMRDFSKDDKAAGHPEKFIADIKDFLLGGPSKEHPFLKDERGSFDLKKVVDDFKNSVTALGKVHEADSYISKKSTGPADDYARSIDEKLHANRQMVKNDILDNVHWASDAFKKNALTKELDRKFYGLKERDQLGTLTPDERAIYDKIFKDKSELNDALHTGGRQLDPKRFGEAVPAGTHVQRIVLNGDPKYYNEVLHSGASNDPVEGRLNALSTGKKGAAADRAFFALEHADGRRFVISPNKNGYTLWNKYKGIRVKDPGFEFKQDGNYTVGKNKWTMKQAYTDEIEANARLEGGTIPVYNKSLVMSEAATNVVLRGMVRDIKQVMDLKNSDEFKKFATQSREIADERSRQSNSMVANGEKYEKTKLPNLDDWYVHPDLRAYLDNFAQPGFDGFDSARAMAQGVTKLLFWLPTAHINNVGAHWFVERGWDWVNPMAYRRLLPTAMRAIKSVMTQDDIQNVLRREGAGTIYGGVVTRDWMKQVGKMVGTDMKENPSKWDPIAKALGWGPSTLIKAWYDGSQRVMWAVNDMFMTQAYLENMLKGHSMTGAIRSTERHIPNYRLPGKVIGSGSKGRFFGKLVGEAGAISFGRYHYEVFNSFAHMAKDMVYGDAGQKFQALGNIMAMGILGLGIYPLMDQAAKLLTGNDHATAHRRGPMAVGSLIHDSVTGSKDPIAALRSGMTINPLAQAILEARSNKDFAGRNIIEPGAVKRTFEGHPAAAARSAGQGADYLLRSLVSPYGTFANAYQSKGQYPPATFRDQALDLKNPSRKAIKGEALAGKKGVQADKSRFKHGGRGPLENLIDKVTGF